ncbi:hypothetical protein NDU88_000273 [Pleurodeles waltl]|uniref:Secreted protein n=1 Tax=Pleurodeles waltl TaxID=8319 RepID=A0AAV7S9M5_PLEWA|nr:hypothetical protein NDU88_000273 [Pleurodeles waltl]
MPLSASRWIPLFTSTDADSSPGCLARVCLRARCVIWCTFSDRRGRVGAFGTESESELCNKENVLFLVQIPTQTCTELKVDFLTTSSSINAAGPPAL